MKIYKLIHKITKENHYISENTKKVIDDKLAKNDGEYIRINTMKGQPESINPREWNIKFESDNYKENKPEELLSKKVLQEAFDNYKDFKNKKDKFNNFITAEIAFGLKGGYLIYTLGGNIGVINYEPVKQFQEYWDSRLYSEKKQLETYNQESW